MLLCTVVLPTLSPTTTAKIGLSLSPCCLEIASMLPFPVPTPFADPNLLLLPSSSSPAERVVMFVADPRSRWITLGVGLGGVASDSGSGRVESEVVVAVGGGRLEDGGAVTPPPS